MNTKKLGMLLFLSICFLLGLILRTYRLLDWLQWDADSGRDFTVAARILLDKGPYFVQVVSGSSSNLVINSPAYYLLMTFMYATTNSVIGACVLFALWNILGIYVAYRIGCLLGTTRLGLLCCALVSGSYFFVTMSRMIWSPTILLTLTLITLFTILKTTRSKNMLWMYLCFASTVLGTQLYYGYIPIALVTNSILIAFLIQRTKKKSPSKYVCYFITSLITLYGVYFLITTKFHLFFQWMINSFSLNQISTKILSNPKEIITYLFFNQNILIGSFIFVASILILIYEAKRTKKIFHQSTLFLLYLLSFALLAFYPETLYFARIIAYYPIFLLLFAYCTHIICKNHILFWTVGIFLLYLSASASISYLISTPPKSYERTEEIVQQIISDADIEHKVHNIDQNSIGIHYINDNVAEIDWATGQYWYFIERIRQKKYVSVINGGNNLQPLQTKPQLHYLICKINTPDNSCSGLKTFLKNYQGIIDPNSQTMVTNTITDGFEQFHIFRWSSLDQ